MGQNNRRTRNIAYVAAYCDCLCIAGKPGSYAINRHLFREGTKSAQQFWRDLCLSRYKGSAKSGKRYRKLYIKMVQKANTNGYRNTVYDRDLGPVEVGLVLDIIATRKKGRRSDTLLDDWPDEVFAAAVLNVSVKRIKEAIKPWNVQNDTDFRSAWKI